MGRLYKRGDTYWGAYKDPKGRPQRHSLHTSDREVAKERLRRAELDGPDRAAHQTLGGALSYMLDTVYAGRNDATIESYRQKARHLGRVFGAGLDIAYIDRKACQGYRALRLKEGASDHSVYKEMVVLRIALREQGIEGVVPKVSAKYKPRERYLTLDAFGAVMAHLPAKRRLWFMAACFLGARDSELAKLRWEDVDLVNGIARVRGTKTKGADRPVPIHPAVMPYLHAVRLPKGIVIERWTNRRRDVTAAYWKVVGFEPPPGWSHGKNKKGKTSIKGAPRISPNDLRRTFISWLKQQGVDSLLAARIAGTGVRMVETVYGRFGEDAFRDAIKRLPPPTEEGK